jgi:hypothetical protein
MEDKSKNSPVESMREHLDWLKNSPEGQAQVASWRAREDMAYAIQEKHMQRLEAYLETVDFNTFLVRMIDEHDEAYKDRCYKQGFFPKPKYGLTLLFNLAFATNTLEDGSDFEGFWDSEVAFYRGYYFAHVHGQGIISKIYNSQKELIFNIG